VASYIDADREKLAVMFQKEAELSHLDTDTDSDTLIIQIDSYADWFSVIPMGERVLVSAVNIVGPRGVPADLDARLMDKIESMGGGRCLHTRAAVVSISEPAEKSFKENIILSGDSVSGYGMATIFGALSQGILAGQAVHRYLAGSHYSFPDYDVRWRKATSQGLLNSFRYLLPILTRLKGSRIDKVVEAMNGKGIGPFQKGPFWLRIPSVLYRLLV
jgi:flavin-dependent dehydrogenase